MMKSKWKKVGMCCSPLMLKKKKKVEATAANQSGPSWKFSYGFFVSETEWQISHLRVLKSQ